MMSRKVWKRCVASAALTLIALGLGWGWTNWRGRPELLAQGISAYADHDYRRAAEVARDRLKAAPADTHALRLLARATARLGRDGPANALFSRLGSSALQPEDLFLLGLGLNRAGQKESAERVWEKGLALEPDHAETIEQLIGRYAAQNRLAEAAELAERLTRQTGWELRGELFLSTFRAEMSDPAGAAVVLERALERPEFLRLNRTATIHYRELLARSLLKIERPKEAREVLQKVLQYGERPEASWLLSRAALQDGAIPESIAALGSAGSYRSEHPLELEPGPYVGEARCAPCHHDKGRAVQANRHNSTLVRGKPLAELPYPQGSVPDPDDPTVTHRFRLEGDKVHLETRARDQVWKAVVDYAFGSPRRYFSLVGHNDQGSPYIFRLSHYQSSDDSGWVRTTGHSTDPRGDQNFLGKAIDVRDGIYKCLFCHTTDPRAVLDRAGPVAADRGIGCERCHGPGGNHLRAVEAKLSDLAIVNPTEAPAQGRIRVCGQCHSNHQELPLARTDPISLRFPGTTIAWSRCYTESAGSFDCMSCHDPHHDNDRSPSHYNARCLACHSALPREPPAVRTDGSNPTTGRAVRGSTCPIRPAEGCIGCHMPYVLNQPLHATFTDHYIRVHPDSWPPAAR
jgi:tetratricopeptide (TPR) repeat protein